MSAPSSPGDNDAVLRSYLALLGGRAPDDHFLEIRYRAGDRGFAREFHPVHDLDALVRGIQSRGSRTDVYVGCAPRCRESGTKDAIKQVWTLWAECDGEDSARRLDWFLPTPTLIIRSGSGANCHGYWRLATPIGAAEAEAANLRLAHAVKADLACFDASRILRPPGTFNFKHEPPTPVDVARFDTGISYNVGAVVRRLPNDSDKVVSQRWERPNRNVTDDPLLTIRPRDYVTDLLGVRPGRDNKVPCPFHADKRPSLHVYPTGARGWCCFSCRRGGTIYDLASELWGLGTRGRDFIEVRRRLTEQYEREIGSARTGTRGT